MPRAMRVDYPGAIYHVMERGDRQEDIFVDDVDRQDFLKTLAEAGQKTGWQIHAYGLMRNHFHLVLETPNANLVAGMRWFLSAYTIRLNHRQKLFGHVFSGRYKALLVEGSGHGYLKTACDYGHLNPLRVQEGDSALAVTVVEGVHTFVAFLDRPGDLATHLLDARVRLEGVCGTRFNERHQLVGIQLFVPSAKHVAILRPGVANLADIPETRISSLLQYTPGEKHQVRVRGTVTLVDPAGTAFVEDST